MKRFPWLKLRKKTDPEFMEEPPIWMGNHSNGEYFHQQTPKEAMMRQEILRRADEQSRYLGMERREFLASSMGMVTSLAVINQMAGCDDNGAPSGRTITGPYVAPVEATCEESDYLSGDEFIFDIQTHSFDEGSWRETNIVYPIFLRFISSCSDRANPLDCMDRRKYAELMFVDSDTSMAVITSWPAASCFPERELLGNAAKACGLPLSNTGMRELRDWLNTRAMSERVINQVQVMPNDMIEYQIEGMHAAMADPAWQAASWKCYPAWKSDTYQSDGVGRGYFLTDPVGRKFIEAGLHLGVPNFAVHKGLPIPGFDVEHNYPWDIGPVANDYPDANFVVYHSAIGAGLGDNPTDAIGGASSTETGPYDPDAPRESLRGTNTLIRSLLDAGIGPGGNVYAELGSAWSAVMRDANRAQHFIGKLLKYVGEDNICWGTDCILGGSPQSQIQAFRAFTITPQFQEEFGYPELTPEIKKKIFGLNAAKFYRVDPERARCNVQASQFAQIKREMDGELGPNRWAVKPPLGPRTRREFLNLARENRAKGTPG